jgi:putative SOS response-associated peptidase YedK
MPVGFVPSWWKPPKDGPLLSNAKAETVATNGYFRSAYKRRRCLIPATGFYEWIKRGKNRLPYLFRMKAANRFAFAGLWERWSGDGEEFRPCTIITTEPNDLLAAFHDRMPVIVRPDDFDLWRTGEPDKAAALLGPYPSDDMTARPVSTLVNGPKYDGPDILAETIARN